MNIECMDAESPERLPIVIEGQTFEPSAEGLWSLNEIHRGLALPESKAPSEWNNSVSAELEASGNFRKVDKVGSFADQLGTIAYAMWVSTAFYLMVARAFVAMRDDSILSARMAALALIEKEKLLVDNMPKADALMSKAAAHGISWTDACRAARISHSGLAKQYLMSIGKFCRAYDHYKGDYTIRPIPSGFQRGFFKRNAGRFGNADGWKVSASGIVWLEARAGEINAATVEMKRRNRKPAKRRLAALVITKRAA